MTDKKDLGKILRQRRVMIPLTLGELSAKSGVSPSHLGRIERGNRFPSARVLHKIAKPLGFDENGLFTLAGFLFPQSSSMAGSEAQPWRLDPNVAAALSQEPLEIQRSLVAMLSILKTIVKGSGCNIGVAEYVRRNYPEVNEDTIAMIENILEHPLAAGCSGNQGRVTTITRSFPVP